MSQGKDIRYSSEMRSLLKSGVDKLADAVQATLGPKGMTVILERGIYQPPVVTKDGVTVAREVVLKNPFEQMGASLVRDAAQKTNDAAGDGTTTATVLARSIVREGIRHVEAGANPTHIRRGIQSAVSFVVEKLWEMAEPADQRLAAVASVSANDKELGKIVSNLAIEIGADGVIEIEETKVNGITTESVKGLRIDRGYLHPFMITNQDKRTAVHENPLILVTERRISNIETILPLLNKIVAANKNRLVIVCDDIDGSAIQALAQNHLEQKFFTLGVRAVGQDEFRRGALEDIALAVGARLLTNEDGRGFEDLELSDLGTAERVTGSKDYTTIVGGAGNQNDVEIRVAQLREQASVAKTVYEREKLESRIARLTGGIAVVRVGAPTEAETKEIRHRIEDAINATKAAQLEGVVTGGGYALLQASELLEEWVEGEKSMSADEKTGARIIVEAIKEPIRAIAQNAGADPGEILALAKRSPDERWNAESGDWVDSADYEIYDPLKVTRLALQNAASAAIMLVCSNCAVAELREEKKAGDKN